MKTLIENSFGPLDVFDIHTRKMRAVVREESAKHGEALHIHSMFNDAQRMPMEIKPRTLAQGLFFNDTADPKVIRSIKRAGAFVVSTVGAFDFSQIQWRQSTPNDPLVRLTVLALEISTARNPKAWRHQTAFLGPFLIFFFV